jgi:hypothetical protein
MEATYKFQVTLDVICDNAKTVVMPRDALNWIKIFRDHRLFWIVFILIDNVTYSSICNFCGVQSDIDTGFSSGTSVSSSHSHSTSASCSFNNLSLTVHKLQLGASLNIFKRVISWERSSRNARQNAILFTSSGRPGDRLQKVMNREWFVR